jgi:hydroxyacylglutathione hydrolase
MRSKTAIDVVALRVVRERFVNYCYLALDAATRDAVLIDPAWEPGLIDATLGALGARLRGVCVTHHHYDHVDLAGHYGARGLNIYMSAHEAEFYGFRCTGLRPLDSEQPLHLGAIEVVPLSTPGHTAGSVCYLVGDSIFTGDTVFAEGCGICTGRGANPSVMFDSLDRLKRRLEPETRVFPGHRFGLPPGQTWGTLLTCNLYLQFARRELFVDFRMRRDQKALMAFR